MWYSPAAEFQVQVRERINIETKENLYFQSSHEENCNQKGNSNGDDNGGGEKKIQCACLLVRSICWIGSLKIYSQVKSLRLHTKTCQHLLFCISVRRSHSIYSICKSSMETLDILSGCDLAIFWSIFCYIKPDGDNLLVFLWHCHLLARFKKQNVCFIQLLMLTMKDMPRVSSWNIVQLPQHNTIQLSS